MSVFERVSGILSQLIDRGEIKKEDFQLFQSYSLSRLTSFRTGGDSTVLFPEKLTLVEKVVPRFHEENIPYFVLGNGTNVIAKDEGYDGVILSLSHLKEARVEGKRLIAQCGASITALSNLAQKNSLSGMEFFYGIPGTVGGAVFMNAGAYGGECKDILESVAILTREGSIKSLSVEELNLGYRTSIFQQTGELILSAVFSLTEGKKEEIRSTMEDLMERRIAKQPLEYPSAGSTFRRCEGRFTAKMIEDAGLKGTRRGGAQVSEKHAGFLINYDHATSADIFDLIDHVKEVIWEKEGVRIQCEIRVIE